VNLFALCVGDAFSVLLTYGEDYADFFGNYKFHLAMPITVFLMIVIPLMLRKCAILATGIGLTSLGMCHMWLDFRMAGATCILIGFVLLARCITESRLRSLYLTFLALALLSSSFAIYYLYATTDPAFAARRQGSNSQRLSLALAGVDAIQRSPVFGLGSWVWDAGMWNVYAQSMGRSSLPDSASSEALGPHSQLLQAWAEAGLLGIFFFLYFGNILARALWKLFFRWKLDMMSPLFLFYLLLSLWALLFSPFANLHRFQIAVSLVITVHVLSGKAAARNPASGPLCAPNKTFR